VVQNSGCLPVAVIIRFAARGNSVSDGGLGRRLFPEEKDQPLHNPVRQNANDALRQTLTRNPGITMVKCQIVLQTPEPRMQFVLQPWQLYFVILAGWVNQQQQQVIEYLHTENQVWERTQAARNRTSARP
jgi:hypothetical protein